MRWRVNVFAKPQFCAFQVTAVVPQWQNGNNRDG